MHAVSWMLKRGHLQTVSYGQQLVKKVRGMTPARFDLLYVLLRVAPPRRPPYRPRRRWSRPDLEEIVETQVSLGRKLGLHRSTVSKMLQRLEEMGWISRVPCEEDRRTSVVLLTEEGRRMMARAFGRVMRRRTLRKAYEELFAPKELQGWEPFDLLMRGQWKGDHASAVKACEAIIEAKSKPGYNRFIGQRPPVLVLDEIYSTLRKIAHWFGDRSNVWFDLGGNRPASA